MASEKREVCERQVVDAFQNAGVADPSLHTRLEHVHKDKWESALDLLAVKYEVSFESQFKTLAEVAEHICMTKNLR